MKEAEKLIIAKENSDLNSGFIDIGIGNLLFFTLGSGDPSFSMEFKLKLNIPVDAEIYRQAVKKTLQRFWNFRLRAVLGSNLKLKFINNTAEPVVFYDDGKRYHLGTAEVAHYLFVALYTENEIAVRAFHGIVDARGGIEFMKSLLYNYLTLSGHEIINHDDVLTEDIPEDESERVCEYETFADKDAEPFYMFKPENTYSLEEDFTPMRVNKQTITYEITCDLSEVINNVKKLGVTLTPYLNAILSRAVYGVYEVPADKQVVATCPVDGRKFFGVKALTSFGTMIRILYDRKFNESDFASCVKFGRALMDLQITRANYVKEFSDALEGTLPLLQAFPNDMAFGMDAYLEQILTRPAASTYTISNLGAIKLNDEMLKYVDDFATNSVCRTTDIPCLIYSFKNKLTIRLEQGFERSVFAEKVVELLKEQGINAELKRLGVYKPDALVYDFGVYTPKRVQKDVKLTEPISVTGGIIRGYVEDGLKIYKGIPYAAAPVGALRWRAPAEVESWDGEKQCIDWQKSPIQSPQAPFMMWTKEFIIEDTGYSEDCLYLNVWTSSDTKPGAKRPVIVFIHGGNLVSGGPSCEIYGGSEIAKRGAVYVSIGFRVGILGLLATSSLSAESENHVSGNYMLLDQIKALKWLHENIAKFGGDPENITITGLSAGADNVNALCVSPLAKGLFKRAFAMSYVNYGIKEAMPPYRWSTLAELEASGDALMSGKSLEEMRAMPAEMFPNMYQFRCNLAIDGYVLDRRFSDAVDAGAMNGIDYISGMVTGDGLIFRLIPFMIPAEEKQLREIMRMVFGDKYDEAAELYPFTQDNINIALDNMGHDAFLASMYMLCESRRRNNSGHTYIYEFARVTPGPESDKYGAFHSSDMPYFWDIFSDERKEYWTDGDLALGKKLCDCLVNFASNGELDKSGVWKDFDGEHYCKIDVDGFTITAMDERKRALWVNTLSAALRNSQ